MHATPQNFPDAKDTNLDPSRSHFAVVDIALKQQPATLFKGMGDAFFDLKLEKRWSDMKLLERKYQVCTIASTSHATSHATTIDPTTALSPPPPAPLPPSPLPQRPRLRLHLHITSTACVCATSDTGTSITPTPTTCRLARVHQAASIP